MIKRLLVALLVIISSVSIAQEATSSPYSFFGVGSLNFRGTVENRIMGGIGVYSDSIHTNLQNPSGYAQLQLINFTVGGSQKFATQKSSTESANTNSTSIDYLSMAIPLGKKFGAGFGILPLTAVGYNLESQQDLSRIRNSGSGGMNKVFLAFGYQVTPKLSVGVDGSYNFGNIENNALMTQEGIEYGTRETNRSSLSGFSMNFGATFRERIFGNLELISAVTYSPETNLTSENSREVASVLVASNGQYGDVDARNVFVPDSEITFPSQLTLGLGIGKPKNWFLGAEYTNRKTSNFTNRSFTLDNVEFVDSNQFKIGGFYIPRYNSISNYWERVTYRAGMRYENTGLIINNEDINEFGISFGVGLPTGRMFSNVNLGIELGQRGTVDSGLVQENFYNIFLSLSLNDKWFVKTLYD